MFFTKIFYVSHEGLGLMKNRDRLIIIDMGDLRKKIIGDPMVSGVFNAGAGAYLVGGYLRDLICGVRSKDIDFIVEGDIKGLLPRIFPEKNKSIIEFKKIFLVRVVVGDNTIDFSELKGGIEDDLKRRDFTMNAIAWSPKRGIIDPLDGAVDIEKCRIRAISERNFVDDPLRLIRAYRFAGELGWTIDGETRKIIRKLKNSIEQSATERITLEIIKLLNSDGHLKALKTAFADGLLQEILSIDNNQLRNNIKALSRFQSFLKRIPEEHTGEFSETFSQELTRIGLLRAELLFYGSSMGKNNLRLSKATLKRIVVMDKLLREHEKNRDADDMQIFELFEEAGGAVMDFALLTGRKRFLKKAKKFMNISPALPTNKVMEITGLGSESKLGAVLKGMRRLQFLGKIKNEKDARVWLSEHPSP